MRSRSSSSLFKMIEGERAKVNFLIFYEIDQQAVKTGKQCCAWRTMIVGGFCWQASKRT